MKYIIQISTPPNFHNVEGTEAAPRKSRRNSRSEGRVRKSTKNALASERSDAYSSDGEQYNQHNHSPKEITNEVIEKVIDDTSSGKRGNPIREFTNHKNFRKVAEYLDKHRINYKHSITANGFILDCSAKKLESIITSNKRLIDLVVKDTKIILHQPHAADLKGNQMRSNQWIFDAIDVTPLWEKDIRGQGTLIAIFDTGVDVSHCQLKCNYSGIWKDFVNSNVHDTEGGESPYDDNGHGTFLCGIACGENTNDFTIGVAPRSKWMCYKILNHGGLGYFSSFIEACDELIMNGIYPDVVNCSFNLITSDGKIDHNYVIIAEGVVSMLESYNIFVCFSAGNTAEIMNYPACLSNVFSVGSFDINNKVAPFSSYGTYENTFKPDIVGPGVNVLSCIPKTYMPDEDDIMLYDNSRDKYCLFSGTSFSSAYISGSIALIVHYLKRRGIPYDVDIVKNLLTQHLLILSRRTNEIYKREPIRCGLSTTSTLVSVVNSSYANKNGDQQKYWDHPINGILKGVPKSNKVIVNSQHPKFAYLNLQWLSALP
jgi:subtilisin family serine protease